MAEKGKSSATKLKYVSHNQIRSLLNNDRKREQRIQTERILSYNQIRSLLLMIEIRDTNRKNIVIQIKVRKSPSKRGVYF